MFYSWLSLGLVTALQERSKEGQRWHFYTVNGFDYTWGVWQWPGDTGVTLGAGMALWEWGCDTRMSLGRPSGTSVLLWLLWGRDRH